MRDLRTEELSQVYGAGGRGRKSCKPPKRRGGGSGSGGRGGSGSGGRRGKGGSS